MNRPAAIEAAKAAALAQARWEALDLGARRPAELVPGLMRGRAAELAASPLAQDQLLSLALDRLADGLPAGGPAPLSLQMDQAADEGRRRAVREQVFRQGGLPISAGAAALAELERRHRPLARSPGELSVRLEAEARLHEALWDDPDLPADPTTRLTMLSAVPRLKARADELSTWSAGRRGGVMLAALAGLAAVALRVIASGRRAGRTSPTRAT